jgi:glycosyltransferase involved in cell wall biosynthesis
MNVLFINSGILGHHAVAELLQDAAARMPGVAATHINLSSDLTICDRLVRRVLCTRLAPASGWAANVDLARWRQQMNAGLLAARRIAAASRQQRFDVLHFHTQATAFASLRLMQQRPAIVSIDATERQASAEMMSSLARATYGANVRRDASIFRAATAITATSDWAARDVIDAHPDCAAKVHVMPYPVRTDGFDEAWIAERQARAAHATDPVRFLFIGGDFPRKGGALLLAAWRNLAIGHSAELDLVTDWPLDPRSMPDGVRIVRGVRPYTPRWFDLWRRADVFVMPTRHEAFGMVFQEAAAAGLPAIGTSINAIPELIVDGETGVLVPADECRALTSAMRALVESADLRYRMGGAARRRILDIASLHRYAAALNRLMNNAVHADA